MDDLIYNQRRIPTDQWRYGFRSSAATGCGWIATYNAMRLMGYRVDIDDLIRWYRRIFPLVHGNFGTTTLAPALRFWAWGFPVKVYFRRKHFDAAVENSDVCILFYYWRQKWKLGAHFVALRHTPEGILGYNTYKNSAGPDRYGPSLTEFLKKRRYFGPVLICIRDKRKQKG